MEFAQQWTSMDQDLSRLRLRRVPLILMYHAVGHVSEDPHRLCVTPRRFAEQMASLAECGLRGVSVDTLVAAMRAGQEQGLVGITFDDGYVNVLENAVPELLRHAFTATMFIVAGQLGGINEWDVKPIWPLMSLAQVKEVAAAGMEVGSHSTTHAHLRKLDANRLQAEVGDSRSRLSDLLGQPVGGFAYPYGVMDDASRGAVREAGYDYACSVVTSLVDMGIMALPRIGVIQRDNPARMRVKRTFFRGNTAARGTWVRMSHGTGARGQLAGADDLCCAPGRADRRPP
jgi:peptidoglycan/xylan/chitin deacetylase (PgdA/CDA1 family)